MTEDDKLYVLPCRTCQPLKWRIFHETVGQPELRTKRLQANFGIAASWTHDGGIDSQIKQWTGA
jgi:hypothetical protein